MNLIKTINSFKFKGVIRKSFFMEHFKHYPRLAKFMFFCLERSGDVEKAEYIHDGVYYKQFECLLNKNPDNYQSKFYMFKYPNLKTDKLLFFRRENET